MAAPSAAMDAVGLDLGSLKVMAVLPNGELVRNELGGVGVASAVCYSGRERFVGEAGVQNLSANPANSVGAVHGLAGVDYAAWSRERAAPHRAFASSPDAAGHPAVTFTYRGAPLTLSGTVLLGTLLAKVRANLVAAHGAAAALLPAAFVCHPDAPPAQLRAFADAARVAGFPGGGAYAFPAARCAAALYARKHPVAPGAPPRTVVFLDMGSSQTTISIVRFAEDGGGGGSGGGGGEVLASVGAGAGAADFDYDLFDHFRVQVREKYMEDVEPGSKRGARLLRACKRLRELLSTIPEARTTVENLCADADVPLSLSRAELAAVCKSSLDAFAALLHAALAKAGPEVKEQLSSVEVAGGGARMPLIQDIVGALGVPMGYKMDDAALACGAAILGAAAMASGAPPPPPPADASGMSDEQIADAIEAEAKMAAADAELHAIAERKNALEGLLLSMRGALDGARGALLPRDALAPYLDEVDDWLYTDEAAEATLEQMTAKEAEVTARLREMCAGYYAAEEQERKAKEEALEADAARAAAERAADPDAIEEDADRDSRRLKKPERMRLLAKNKEEGNELFQGGNWTAAGARYAKALSHAAKFVDLSPDEQTEVDALKVALYMNLSQVYLKLEKWDMVVANCSHALKIDAKSSKALYRRGYAYFAKKQYDKSEADLDAAFELAPQDAAVLKMRSEVKKKQKMQAKAEKSMWARAFGAS
ncbi:heat shock protein 70 [Tribonema minus]|uniref:Heat shock protein 70 n=1 Tax=Tribonema minus TaxID=303371 RepID=A0A835ZFU7_9STRA|nr:heat shock protein 70 [Tribonema minus]